MKSFLRLTVAILLGVCMTAATFAQQARNIVEVRSYSVGEGMTQKMVQNVVQDEDNFVWMATWNGLEKFDGYTFRNYKSYPTDSVRLAFNRLPSVTVGPDHILWCETYDARMFIFDTREERFIDLFALHPEVKPCEEFVRKFSLPDGILWLAARDGSLWRIDGKTYRERGSVRLFQATRPERGETIYGIYPDGKGGEWIFSNHGYWVYGRNDIHGLRDFRHALLIGGNFLLIGGDGSLASADTADGTIRDIPLDARIIHTAPPLLLTDGRVALMTDRGPGLFDPVRKTVTHIDLKCGNRIVTFYEQTKPSPDGILWALTDVGDVLRIDTGSLKGSVLAKPYSDRTESLEMQFIHQDSWGQMWIYPLDGHLCHYNSDSGLLERVYTYSDRGIRLVPDITFYMIDDRDNLWGCTKRGIQKFTFPSGYACNLSDRGAECRGLMIDSRGRLWTGYKDLTVALYDSTYRYIGNLSPSGEIRRDESTSFGASVYSFLEDSRGRIWLGSRNDGLFIATPTGRGDSYTIRNFRHRPDDASSLSNDAVYSIYEDRNHRIWVGTYGGGLNLIDERPDGSLGFRHASNGGLPTFPGRKCRNVRYITCSSKGEMMLGTSGGFVTFDCGFDDPAEIKFYRNWCDISRDSTLSNSDVLFAMEDSRHDIYLAIMSGGVCRLKAQDLLSDRLEFSYINQRSGLPSDMVYSMREDMDGKIWIAVENAICLYDPDSDRLEVFGSHDFHRSLLIGEAPFVIDSRGTATMGLGNAMLQVDLRHLRKSDYAPNVVFYEARLQGTGGSEKTIRIHEPELDLAPEYRNISVSFVALDYSNSENISYAYRLKGFNDHWVDNGHNHTASFYALPAGDYVLEVKATNSEGAWSDRIYSLKLHIRPTFIETVWAKLLYVLAFLVICLAVWYVSVYILRLQRRIDMEQELTAMKLKFFTDVSHELRTPLTLIINPIDEVLADRTLSPSSREYMSLAKSNTDRMLRLINQFLDIRKIQNSKMKIYLERTDIVALLGKMHHDFTGLARQKHIDFRYSCTGSGRMMYTDIDKVEKIVFNLLSNAFKYTPDGKSISLAAVYEADRLVISVSDQGPGIEEWQKNALFRRFENFGRKRRVLSSGIGLSLVKELVDILHGSISVSGSKGEGCTFTVTLPGDYGTYADDTNVELILNDEDSAQTSGSDIRAIGEADSSPDKPDESSGDRLHVLVVDDNDELRHMMTRMLCSHYTVTEAEDGAKALEMLADSQHQPDIIISDIMMPRVDGLELLARVRANNEWSHIPFVLLSAKASVYDRIEGLECGADDYLTKPFSASYLRARLKSIIARRSRLREFFLGSTTDDRPTDNASDQTEMVQLTDYDSEFVRNLIQYIEREVRRTDLTIDEIATAMGLGRTMFNRKVKSLLNVTPIELLVSVRLRLARTMLSEGRFTVSEITYKCGFSSPQYFSRVFKQANGCTPGEYARNHRS